MTWWVGVLFLVILVIMVGLALAIGNFILEAAARVL